MVFRWTSPPCRSFIKLYEAKNIFRAFLNGRATPQQIYSKLQPFHSQVVDSTLWAAFTLAFFSFLRSSEFTCNGKFDPHNHLSRSDIIFNPNIFNPNFLEIIIKKSKTDPSRETANLTIARSHSNVCAVTALQQTDRVPPSLSSNSPIGATLSVHHLPATCVPFSASVAWTVQTSPHTAFVLAQPKQREQLDFLTG